MALRKITQDELKEILRKHQLWLNNEDGGERADLRYSDLRYSDLRYSNLGGSDLRYSDLRYSDLRYSNLGGSDLRYSDLRYSNLSGSDLRCSNLRYSNLSGSDLRCSDLRYSNLGGSDLRYSNLSGSDLRYSNLSGIQANEYTAMFWPVCPETGAFVGYKKARELIVKLLIPEDAKRSSAATRKCRCSKAKVLAIENADGTPSDVESVSSNYDASFAYVVGETVEVPDFDEDRWNECSTGIHFFISREEAVRY